MKTNNMLVTKEEIETPRTAAEIRCWADQKIEYLGNTKKASALFVSEKAT